jgi:hypothetical protein
MKKKTPIQTRKGNHQSRREREEHKERTNVQSQEDVMLISKKKMKKKHSPKSKTQALVLNLSPVM